MFYMRGSLGLVLFSYALNPPPNSERAGCALCLPGDMADPHGLAGSTGEVRPASSMVAQDCSIQGQQNQDYISVLR